MHGSLHNECVTGKHLCFCHLDLFTLAGAKISSLWDRLCCK